MEGEDRTEAQTIGIRVYPPGGSGSVKCAVPAFEQRSTAQAIIPAGREIVEPAVAAAIGTELENHAATELSALRRCPVQPSVRSLNECVREAADIAIEVV